MTPYGMTRSEILLTPSWREIRRALPPERRPHASTPGSLVHFGKVQAVVSRTWLNDRDADAPGFAARLGLQHLSGLAIAGLS
jgi:hypothetical protein